MSNYYELTTPVEKIQQDGSKKTYWTKCGIAFPLKNKDGFSIELAAVPVNGKLIMQLPYKKDDAATPSISPDVVKHSQDKGNAFQPQQLPDDEIPF